MDKSSKTNYPLNLEQKALLSFETSEHSNPRTKCHLQEDMDFQILKNFERNRHEDME
jgi:hypothetical protein